MIKSSTLIDLMFDIRYSGMVMLRALEDDRDLFEGRKLDDQAVVQNLLASYLLLGAFLSVAHDEYDDEDDEDQCCNRLKVNLRS